MIKVLEFNYYVADSLWNKDGNYREGKQMLEETLNILDTLSLHTHIRFDVEYRLLMMYARVNHNLGLHEKAEEYLYSSARDYFEGKNVGLLNIEWL